MFIRTTLENQTIFFVSCWQVTKIYITCHQGLSQVLCWPAMNGLEMALIHVDDGHWGIISLVPTKPNGNKVLLDCPYVFAKVNGSCPDYELCGPFSSLAHLLDIVSQNGEHFPTTGVICLHFLQKYKNGGILENFVTLSVCKVGNSLPDDTMVKRYVSGPSSY